MQMEKKGGFTLIELVIAMTITLTVVFMFFYIIKNTIVFVAVKKQDITIMDKVNDIKAQINNQFMHDKIYFLFSPDTLKQTHTGAYSVKDNFIEAPKIHRTDALLMQYEEYSQTGGTLFTNSGIIAMGIVDKHNHRLIDPISDEDGYFAIKYMTGGENIKDYFESYSGTASFDDYINSDLNISSFTYDYIPVGSGSSSRGILRIKLEYDNDIDDEYKKAGGVDEYYFSGTTFVSGGTGIKKVD